ncbi:bifunctional GTP diphosphokinase/guanosine-3',5'-bis pyrophosphate 3'-pyrophosphohydrolase [Aestuariirhabdus sp. Z084]|uniref:bifunctional GTP diphosphokinase/guanosine-3',5'-bis pyrophosphate 3'-pyrophosphohydrolase n=1 Tax=Aestuariirhabdus haliotis TaxID=2918751 RepID=UPI00201B3AF9|nr:bifunctional GTP diphosphokinase/guanosine-3',5'-bis pyrophosphate 3'-pyrophosphohydrolase [Aestuariirhabdus haliotis]MCL6414308.1 bifunctional GTP diphosphokinase/guanosine-3',5'-bis pyrophosphate 3'-pyrophosphohydrolase [Aestuariirhabdus haliotis]MCL6418240.1 bifunctional GTP diphosphokinase/guanosine-3',5'-bis pyrophosphate 3'-pyrophosphohydrolase [Aestuariirhabdus haliotis]
MPTINDLAQSLSTYLNPEQINLVRRAYYYAEQAHDGQRRRSGEPYVTHPLAVAGILANMHMDHQSLMAAMLHDVIEDTGIPKEAVASQFGEVVAELVDGVSKLTQMRFETKAEQEAENFQKMALAMAKDIRVILVKLADRLHNMRTLGVMPAENKRRKARETMEIYVPIALRLGMNSIRVEMEELCFKAIYPMRASRIQQAVKQARGNRKELVSTIRDAVNTRLREHGLEGSVTGREKHLYSIYKKMRVQRKPFAEIMDVYAFRIIVPTVDDCYRALGAAHNLYKPFPGRFKDYIAIPKANGYQSLHTTLFGMHGVPIEMQIRTQEMEEMANNGIAAHWLYKSEEEALVGSHARTRQWLKGVLELQQNAGDPLEFIENVKIDLFPDEVYIFTPKGNIMEMPKGATAVDFAYAVHTDVGNTCVACRIDRRLASLSQPLQSGQTVEVITAPGAKPNVAWLSFVTTGKARSNIRHYLKNQRHSDSVELGRRLLNRVLASLNAAMEQIPEERINLFLKDASLSSFDELLEEIGLGNRMAYMVAKRLLESAPGENKEQLNGGDAEQPLTIRGTEGMVISFARCCSPIPGDPIVGHVSSGKGMVIHSESCRNISDIRHNPERCLEVEWDKHVSGEFTVALKVELEHQRGMVASLATAVTAADASIEKISLEERDARFSVVELLINVTDRLHLARSIKKLRAVKGVNSITRTRG